MWEITPPKVNDFDCLTGLCVAYANFLEKDYRICFAKTLGYYMLDMDDHLLLNRMHFCRPYSFFDLLERYCNMYLIETKHENFESLKKHTMEGIKSSPIIFNIDAYDCPWCPVYHNYHFDHYLMIVDIDQDAFYCYDSYFPSKGIQKFLYTELTNWSGISKSFLVVNDCENYQDYKRELIETLDYVDVIDYIQQIERLKNFVCHKDILLDNISGYTKEPTHAPFFLIFRSFVMQKKQLLLLLDFLCEKYPNDSDRLHQIEELTKDIKLLYNSIHTVFLKRILMKNYDMSSQFMMFDKIIEKETVVLQDLKSFASN
jgi:hypothetical protein